MKTTIEVESRDEGKRLREGLEDPVVRAFVSIVGILKPLTPRSRARVFGYVTDVLEENEAARVASNNGGSTP